MHVVYYCYCYNLQWYGSDIDGHGGIYMDRKDHEKRTCRHKQYSYDTDEDDTIWDISFPDH